ncbi:MAG: hypothetical protein K0R54_663 [Clostridiaceae bacterium]|jgi:hypothetical protein|nr:hypothetical protein [Clostridiaceae bacterium]
MIYGIVLTLWLIIMVLMYNTHLINKTQTIEFNKFESSWHNKFYQWSYVIPFKWFVEDDNNLTIKGDELKNKLKFANLLEKYTVSSFMTYKTLVFMICILLAGINLLIAKYSSQLSGILLGIETEAKELEVGTMLLISMFWLAISLIPNIILKSKVKRYTVISNKDIPILQMFIILMLRSSKTITEILFALSKLNTHHRFTFEQGYRIYIRNKHEGMEYLKDNFQSKKFVETFALLEDIGEYAKDDCIMILESNFKTIVEETALIKRKNDLSQLIYTQASMVVPFVVIITLTVMPLVVTSLNMLTDSGMF